MKKKLLIISTFSLGLLGANAQITITTADVATAGHTIYSANDTLPTISVGSSGTSQTWNMTALSQNLIDTLMFLSPIQAPNSNFPTSNLMMQFGWQSNYGYLRNTAASLTVLGNSADVNIMGTPISINQINTPAEKLATFPFTYSNSFVNNYVSNAKFYFGQTVQGPGGPLQVDSIRTKSVVHKTVDVDAWGTLTTPLGTYNVIRSKETKISLDSTDAYIVLFPGFGIWQNVTTSADSTTSYTWWANSVGYPLVTATMDSAGAVKRVQWLQSLPVTTGINESELGQTNNVFPNPAQDEINILSNVADQKSIQVFDMTGRLIDSYSVSNKITTINTSSYANGIYTYTILGKDSSIGLRGKFTIAK